MQAPRAKDVGLPSLDCCLITITPEGNIMGEIYVSSNNPGPSAQRAHGQSSQKKRLTKAVVGVTLGNMVEWFDFALYSSLAGIIGKTFFHNDNPTAQLMAIYATFAAGFLIRPLGSMIFG
ncbi:MAG TPA: hypothetical protein VN798_19940, partial [Pseudomonas sp.]|nr:hypothetical protein [Pseudomonas sp.]